MLECMVDKQSAKLWLNLLEILTVDNIYRLEVLKFSPDSWYNGFLPKVFHGMFQYA